MFKDVTPQGWLISVVVLIVLLVAATLIIMGAARGDTELRYAGMELLLPLLTGLGVYQAFNKK